MPPTISPPKPARRCSARPARASSARFRRRWVRRSTASTPSSPPEPRRSRKRGRKSPANASLDEARDGILNEAAGISDLIAGGAKLEEIASETDLELGSIELNAETTGGLADDPAFLDLANAAREGEETDLAELANGGLVTLRLEGIDPAAVIPLDQIRERVAADWTAARTAEALATLAETYRQELAQDVEFTALAERLGLRLQHGGPLTRGEVLDGAPPELIADLFAAEPGGTVVRTDGDTVILARLSAIEPFDPQAEGNAAVSENLKAQFRTQAADDLLALYTERAAPGQRGHGEPEPDRRHADPIPVSGLA